MHASEKVCIENVQKHAHIFEKMHTKYIQMSMQASPMLNCDGTNVAVEKWESEQN